MTIWHVLREELTRGVVQSLVAALVVLAQLALYFLSRQTRPHIRFQKLKDYANHRVTFLIRNLDSVRYRESLVIRLEPRAAIERVHVHGGPYCEALPGYDEDEGGVVIRFKKVPANATFSIKVKLKPQRTVKLRLAGSSPLRPRSFNDKLAPFRGVRRFGYFLLRGLAGLIGFVSVLLIGLALDGDAPGGSDWAFIGAALPLALAVFVLVVPTGGKPIVAGYLGWSAASKNWPP